MEKALVEELVDVAEDVGVDVGDVVDVEDVGVDEGLTHVDEDVASWTSGKLVSKQTILEGFLSLPSWPTELRRSSGRTRRTWGGPTELAEATESAAKLAAGPEVTETFWTNLWSSGRTKSPRSAVTNLRSGAELAATPEVAGTSAGTSMSARSAVDDVGRARRFVWAGRGHERSRGRCPRR